MKVQQQQGVINLVLAYATLAKEVIFLKDIIFQKIKNRQYTNQKSCELRSVRIQNRTN